MYPKYVEVNGKRYKINTSYKYALKCNEIAEDENINDIERALGIIYVLFGEDALNDTENAPLLIEKAQKYLLCGQEPSKEETRDMDFNQDFPLIRTSLRSDYGINLDKEDLHWWEFYELVNGLSSSDIGNCCILNRVRNLRNFDLNDIKDFKEKEKIRKAKESVALKKKKKVYQNEQQKQSAKDFYMNLYRKE